MVLIDMEMPTGCYNCAMLDSESSWCHAAEAAYGDTFAAWTRPFSDYEYRIAGGMPDWCPLKEVKDGKNYRKENPS